MGQAPHRRGLRGRRQRLVGLAAIIGLSLSQFVSQAVARPRPFRTLPHLLVAIPKGTDYSFPSDHATIAGAIAVGLLLLSWRVGLLAWVLALFLAFARVYVGAPFRRRGGVTSGEGVSHGAVWGRAEPRGGCAAKMAETMDNGSAGSRPGDAASWWRRRSLRTRLTAAATLVIAMGMAVAALLLVYRVHSALIAGLDDSAAQRAQEVAAAIDRGELTRRLPDTGEGAVAQAVDSTGRVVASSANLAGNHRLFSVPPSPRGVEPPAHKVTNVPMGKGSATYRVVALAVRHRGHKFIAYAGLPTTEADRSMDELAATLMVGLPVLTVLLAAVGWLLVGRAIRPVEGLRAQAADITATDLHRRLALPGPPRPRPLDGTDRH